MYAFYGLRTYKWVLLTVHCTNNKSNKTQSLTEVRQ